MEMEKNGDWGSSSKEITDTNDRTTRNDDDDNDNDNDDNDNAGIGRTYECSYCKRGFTNAQALGGHMNIHRKDKAKANKHPSFSSSYSSPSSISYKLDDQVPYSSLLAPHQAYNYGNYPLANNNPRTSQPSIYYGNNDFTFGRSSLFGMYEDHLGVDLSLRINHHQIGEENKKNDGGIDLELRLGYNP